MYMSQDHMLVCNTSDEYYIQALTKIYKNRRVCVQTLLFPEISLVVLPPLNLKIGINVTF